MRTHETTRPQRRTRKENPNTRDTPRVRVGYLELPATKHGRARFPVEIVGERDYDGTVRAPNGIRWRIG